MSMQQMFRKLFCMFIVCINRSVNHFEFKVIKKKKKEKGKTPTINLHVLVLRS